MKRFVAMLVSLGMVLSLCACGSARSGEQQDIDVDLTQMSATMVYAEVANMLFAPEEYMGKVVNMDGTLSVYYNELTDKNYFAVIIADATACCAQGIEFVLAGDYRYPEDYPPEGSYVTVCGVFDTYTEDGYEFCQLVDATMRE